MPEFTIVDRRASAPGPEVTVPAGYRLHALLLGHCDEQEMRDVRRDLAIDDGAADRVVAGWERARRLNAGAAPLDPAAALVPVQSADAIAEITRLMGRPEYRAAFPDGTWAPALVEIGQLIPVRLSLDLESAREFGTTDLDPADPLSALPICFAPRAAARFDVDTDRAQESITVSAADPGLTVMGLRYTRQGENGPLVVSFMIGAPPPLVVVLRHGGRLFLSSGAEPVFHLMQRGFTRLPCVVRDVASLSHIVVPDATGFRAAALLAPRPPLISDFADEELSVVAPGRSMRRVVRIRPDLFDVGI
jgi:hypothetical protein